jgi:putative PIN family toxin of toxin-antitoxin system
MTEIVAVYDTNVLISAFIGRGAPYEALDAVFAGKVRLVISPDMLFEFEDVISRPKFHYNDKQIRRILTIVFKVAKVVEPDFSVDVVKGDTSDNRIIEAAISGKAKYIVTGDSHLLSLGEVENIKVTTVRNFLKILR